ncbi:MAG: DUF3488 domain-containing protein [Planctomycetaceae bacterium]|nr:MAG: DUF3488 domain-containing protein [Planctomycetaceae bacterium]
MTQLPKRTGAGSEASGLLERRLKLRMSFCFALATSLAALTLSGNPDTESLPVIACFFALIGFVFVDWLGWFALPPTAAYLSLGAIALYSVTRFPLLWGEDISVADDVQMVLVAELLVMVQAVLMLQRKNRRIFEQLAIFCLLELVVAAIFNDAISYGLLLIPLGVVGAAALAMLQAHSVIEEAFTKDPIDRDGGVNQAAASGVDGLPDLRPRVRTSSVGAADSFRQSGLILPRVTTIVLTPAVILVSLLFFYGLPRTNPTAQSAGGSRVLVGFTDSIRLGQIGRMLQSDTPVLKIELADRGSGKAYTSIGRLYLRGAVLEKYHPEDQASGAWSAIQTASLALGRLPLQPNPSSERRSPDDVRVRITAEPTNSPALFSIAPYHSVGRGGRIAHLPDRWLLRRQAAGAFLRSSRAEYRFGTTAFRGGLQTRLIPWEPSLGTRGIDGRPLAEEVLDEYPWAGDPYVWQCHAYDPWRVPSAKYVSDQVLGGEELSPLQTALRLERYLASSPEYQYTLDLSGQDVPGLDPIERFLRQDRRGTCQHFGSALALMLRSQGIPSRLVVGYCTDEFNSLGGFHVARQLHAHAWVEALIASRWIRSEDLLGGLPGDPAAAYWVRLDPTPGGGGVQRGSGGRVSEVLDLAQNMWTDYVVERGAMNRQSGDPGDEPVGDLRSILNRGVDWLEGAFAALPVSRSAPSQSDGFGRFRSVLALLAIVGGGGLFWLGYRRLVRSSVREGDGGTTHAVQSEPAEPHFAETVRLLERIGIRRPMGQTPLELTTRAADEFTRLGSGSLDRPLRILTDAFYHARFGREVSPSPASTKPSTEELEAALDSVREAVREIRTQAAAHPNSTPERS